jgi:hypothetical protein
MTIFFSVTIVFRLETSSDGHNRNHLLEILECSYLIDASWVRSKKFWRRKASLDLVCLIHDTIALPSASNTRTHGPSPQGPIHGRPVTLMTLPEDDTFFCSCRKQAEAPSTPQSTPPVHTAIVTGVESEWT